jgi:hypothetical protein
MGQDAEEQVTIPHPRGLPLLGDAMTFMGKDASIMLICEMASQYGMISDDIESSGLPVLTSLRRNLQFETSRPTILFRLKSTLA